MEPNNLKNLFSQPRVIIGSLVTIAAIGGGATALMQGTPQSISQRDTVSVSTTSPTKVERLSATKSPTVNSPTTDLASGASGSAASDDAKNPDAMDSSSSSDPKSSDDRKSTNSADPDSDRENLNKVSRCETTMAKISDPNPPANVRSQPNTDSASVVGKLTNGTFVTVVNSNEGWLKISTPTKGWVSRQIALSGCNQKEERVSFAKGSTLTTIADEFIGTGSHTYQMYLLKGQTMRLRSQKGPRPTILSPQGQEIVAMADDGAPWSGKLAQSGDYKIILDSNFKGYKYAFEVMAE
jgi:uncharacterized protein YgiM (DUF1202 family)